MKPSSETKYPPLSNRTSPKEEILEKSNPQAITGKNSIKESSPSLTSRRNAAPSLSDTTSPQEKVLESSTPQSSTGYGDLKKSRPSLTSRRNSEITEVPLEHRYMAIVGEASSRASQIALADDNTLSLNSLTASAASTEAINLEPRQSGHGVYIGEGRAKSGEKLYFRMELVTRQNQPHWDQYILSTGRMAGTGVSLLKGLALHTKKTIDADKCVTYVNDKTPPSVCGFSNEEFQEFINFLGRNGFVSGGDMAAQSKRNLLAVSDTGSSHMDTNCNGYQYIISASKSRDFSMQSAGNILEGGRMTLNEYITRYSNLVMCVGADFSENEEGSFHNRGIFRNPYSTIENTYKGISMLLHGFSGAVAQKFFPDKKIMIVRPVASMQNIICKALNADECKIIGRRFEDVYKESADKQSLEFPANKIQISALARVYKDHKST